MSRTARVERTTKESLGMHAAFDLAVRATGDTEVDAHHTVEGVPSTKGAL